MIDIHIDTYIVRGDGTKEQDLFMRCPNTRQLFAIDEPTPVDGEVRHIVSPFGFEDDVTFVAEKPFEPLPEGGIVGVVTTEEIRTKDRMV